MRRHWRATHPALAFFAAGALLWLTPGSLAQLLPTRLYCGVDRPVPVRVEAPAGEDQPLTISLLAPATTALVDRAPVRAGLVDLAALFPRLWTDPEPRVLYAQLHAGASAVGPALVLQPLLSPEYARADSDGRPRFEPLATRSYSGLRLYTDKHVVIETSEGVLEFRLRPDAAPNTAFNFLHLVEGGFYTDIPVHRVFPATRAGHPFIIQFGDPTGTGEGSAGYLIDLERSALPHTFGVLSMARSDDPNWNGSQVMVCLSREGTAALDGAYTAFAELVGGAETLLRLEKTPLTPGTDKPREPPVIVSAKAVDAPPYGQGPAPAARPTPPIER